MKNFFRFFKTFFLKKSLFLLGFAFLSSFAFAQKLSSLNLQVKPASEVFFTQTENCYELELPGIEPSSILMELPDLPLGTKFISSKKEEFRSENGERGTLITIWFNFAYSGPTRLSPLLVKINGKTHYFEFEKVMVYENPDFISPVLEISFDRAPNFTTDKKSGKKTLKIKKGEKLSFRVALRYGVQVLDFNWNLPKDSIFTETERFDFADGKSKATQFSDEAKNLSRFEWQILKDGIYNLPEIYVRAVAYNGSQKEIHLAQNIEIVVSGEKQQTGFVSQNGNDTIFVSAFEKPAEELSAQKEKLLTRADCELLAQKEKRTFFQKFFGKRYAIFSGGEICSVPEEKTSGQTFSPGQKVKITEKTGEWSFIESKEFSGWTRNLNLIEIK